MRAMLFLKLFVATAIPFGLVVGLLCAGLGALIGALPGAPISLAHGAAGGFALGVAAGVPFGIAVAIILGLLHFSQTTDPRVRHRRRLVLETSQAEASDMCIEAIHSIPNALVDEESSGKSNITAKKGFTWRSWGDSIRCDIEPTAPNQQTIVIESRPQLRMTIVDYGSNLDNVETVVSHLMRRGASLVRDA